MVASTMNVWTTRPCSLDLHLELADEEQLDELERVLLKARATELGDVRRRDIRFSRPATAMRPPATI